MSTSLIAAGIGTLLSGSLVGAIASLVTGRANSKKLHAQSHAVDAKLPAEVDSLIVAGAEQAVLTMTKAMDAQQRRLEQLAAERAQEHAELESIRGALDACRQDLDYNRDRVVTLQELLDHRTRGL